LFRKSFAQLGDPAIYPYSLSIIRLLSVKEMVATKEKLSIAIATDWKQIYAQIKFFFFLYIFLREF
jgi:hypothetical protein